LAAQALLALQAALAPSVGRVRPAVQAAAQHPPAATGQELAPPAPAQRPPLMAGMAPRAAALTQRSSSSAARTRLCPAFRTTIEPR
jgi:hypothetical protein